MSSWEKELRDKAKAQAEKVIRRAARDGKITKKDFRDVAERTFPLSGSALNNTYMANEIARALKKDPTLRIGKKSAEVTGVRLNKRGQLTHEFPEDRTANFNGNSSPVTFPGRGGYDKGSANWVQNSRGSYTYIGDIPSRTKKEEGAPETPAGTDDPPRDPFAGLTGGESGNDTSSAGDNSSSGGSGSIHFNPGADMIQAVADYGNAATDDYFNRFLPDLYNSANLQAREVGAAGAFHLDRFVGKVPELGDAKDMFKWYKKRID
jgi:hypothetical protein